MNLETKITIYKFTPQVFTLTPIKSIKKSTSYEIFMDYIGYFLKSKSVSIQYS